MIQKSSSDDLDLLLHIEDPGQNSRVIRAVIGSVLFHLLAFVVVSYFPIFEARVFNEPPPEIAQLKKVTPLIAPVLEPTQVDPNKGKINRNFDVDSLQPKETVQVKKSTPASRQPAAKVPPAEFVPPNPVPPTPQQAPKVIEPPKIEIAKTETVPKPQPGAGVPNAPPPPSTPPPEKPKLAFESIGAASMGTQSGGQVPRPSRSVQEASQSAARRPGGLTVGDLGAGMGGLGDISKRPLPGRNSSNLELLSDPEGVDMRPYLVTVLGIVRRNWQSVIPESVKLGRRGRVVVAFAIDRDGGVPKLVIAVPSGADPLDRAAVAGISASNPFPPLPSEFKGGQIRLQFTFSYNMTGN